MTNHRFNLSKWALLAAVSLSAVTTSNAFAEDKVQVQTREEVQERAQVGTEEPIYGSQLMTRHERTEHRAKLRQLKSEKEREAYRLEHHIRMQERAREKGLTLPDAPPVPAGGMGMGSGAGAGGGTKK